MIQEYIAIFLLIMSWVFIIFGMVAIFKLKNLYTRILSAATIDTVGSLTILIALLIANITSYEYVVRFILLIGFLIITNPISSHVNIRSAFLTGVPIKRIYHEAQKQKKDEKAGELNA